VCPGGQTGPVAGWARRVDWCAVVAVPVVTLTAMLDPVDVLNGAIQHLGLRLAPPVGPPAAPAPERRWPAGDVVVAGSGPLRPRSRRPGRVGQSRRTGPLVNSRPPSKPSRS